MKIAVAGTGYVGLVAGACFAEKGHNVICVDVDEVKVNLMKSGKCPIYEEDLEELMIKNYKEGRLNYTTDFKNAYKERPNDLYIQEKLALTYGRKNQHMKEIELLEDVLLK